MNSLITARAAVKKIAFAITLISTLAFAAAAQTIEPQNQGKHYGEPGFVGEPINLNVVNADIRDILSYITDQYGINFVIDKSVKDVPVTVKVNDVPWNIALDSVLQSQELGVQVNGNILRVADNKTLASEGELFRERLNNQLDTSPLYTEMVRLNFATVLGPQGATPTTSGTTVGGAAGNFGLATANTPDIMQTNGAPGVNGVTNGGLLPIIRRRLSRRGSIEVDERSNSLIITDVATNIAAIKQLIAVLDQPEPQVEIEARIVVATRNFSRDIGVQLSGLVIGSRGSGASAGNLPGATTSLPIPPSLPIPSINNGLMSSIANSAIGLTTGIFGTAQLSALITAGEQKGQAKIIATPRVTTLNNQKANIESKTQIPITTIQPGSAAGGAVIATTTYVNVPLSLTITPQITDLGAVILTVTAENSSTATVVGGGAPAINTQSMSTKVTVPDGGTTVVGGVLFDDERESQDRTPGLASIPLLGNLFKRKGVQRNTNEILFFITPRITRPDFATTQAPNTPQRSTTILQPVPMGNPPSNSAPVVEPASSGQVVLPAPALVRPEAVVAPK